MENCMWVKLDLWKSWAIKKILSKHKKNLMVAQNYLKMESQYFVMNKKNSKVESIIMLTQCVVNTKIFCSVKWDVGLAHHLHITSSKRSSFVQQNKSLKDYDPQRKDIFINPRFKLHKTMCSYLEVNSLGLHKTTFLCSW